MERKSDTSKESGISDRQNVSFTFTKKVAKTLSVNKLEESISSNVVKDFVFSVDKKEIKSSVPKEIERDLVIPLIKKNTWRIPSSEINSDDTESKLKDLAIQELIQESKEQREKFDSQNDVTIPLIMQNKIPEGFETEEKMDVSLRPEESTLEDYERIPIEKFGLAILKGMGWKEGDPVGANAKKAIKPVQVEVRPKGLGLGADTSALNLSKAKKLDEKLQLIKGAYVTIIHGNSKGFCGKVLGLDEENARVIVKLSNADKAITFPEFSLEVISKKEFEKESKVINKTMYEKYKREHESKNSEYMLKEETRGTRAISKEIQRNSRDKKRLLEEKDRAESHSKKRSYEKRIFKQRILTSVMNLVVCRISTQSEINGWCDLFLISHHSDSYNNSKMWVQPQLRVRLIDEKFKKGKYFNEKVVVVDVPSSKTCTCRTENDKYLDDLTPSMLETVIPRSNHSYVMIVQGKYRGELCTILEKDKSKCVATVQFLSNRDKALQIDYDSICEYVGDVSNFD